jgi:radical SAM protein with 4Fe4S-binding SPASM domain
MTGARWENAYLRMSADAALKNLETPFIYHVKRDELYEIDDTAASFLLSCDGTRKGGDLTSDSEFVEYCLEEAILETSAHPEPTVVKMGEKTDPSLRYLELHLTHQCNLSCVHCYLGEPGASSGMPIADAVAVTRSFSDMGGLRLLISGGEPLLYKYLKPYLAEISGYKLRRVLLTNGTLINHDTIQWLDVDEIQFSLDGWEKGHDRLRGKGSFKRVMEGIRIARSFDRDVSIATMIHRDNSSEFDEMAAFIKEIGALEWGIDALCVAGTLSDHRDLLVDHMTCARLMEYGFGGGYHGAADGYACGHHLMTVMPDGRAAKCGFYADLPVGDATKGLRQCWEKIEHVRLSQLECGSCEVVEQCRGGCRFRAGTPLGPDPVMCAFYGISP